jgi:hypothetical protein
MSRVLFIELERIIASYVNLLLLAAFPLRNEGFMRVLKKLSHIFSFVQIFTCSRQKMHVIVSVKAMSSWGLEIR